MDDDDVADDSHVPEFHFIQGWRLWYRGQSGLLTNHRHPDLVNVLAVSINSVRH